MGACRNYEAYISAFIDGELSQEDRGMLMEHMAACSACQAYFNDQIAIHDAIDRTAPEAPAGFSQAVMEQVRRTPQEHPKERVIVLRQWRRWAVAVAACCTIVLLSLWGFSSSGQKDQELPSMRRSTNSVGMMEDQDEGVALTGADCADARAQEPAGDLPEEAELGLQSAAYSNDTDDAAENDEPSLFGVPQSVAASPEDAPVSSEEKNSALPGAGGGELVDYETAKEHFGRALVPCTESGFLGYTLSGSEDGGGSVVYVFTNGTIAVAAPGLPVSETPTPEETDTFTIGYHPDGADGLSYTARFDAGTDPEEIFNLLLSLQISE